NHSALFPLVGTLERRPQTPDEVRIYFQLCNVVVTTMAIIGGCSEDVQRAMAEWCSHLFIDEAHHVTAPTWAAFRRHFRDRPILQFTATPFRRDGKHVPGKMLFRYPLRKAQEEGYFKPITFRAVSEYNPVRADEAIARLAVEQLEQDLAEPEPLDHIIMARTDSIERAHEVYEVYRTIGAAHHPQIVHSGMTAAGCRDAIDLLRERRSRLVVCVNMFGEGFDLPSLKIAALHDVHKSLAPTIQFTGRFTRSGSTIGAATVIANTADTRVEEALRALYAEDADWNTLLRYLGEGAADRQIRQAQFLEGFPEIPDGIPIQNLFPKMSTVVYRTNAAHWRPDRLPKRVRERLYSAQAVNEEQKVLLFVTRELIPVPWGDIKELADVVWNLYVIHWDQEQGLLFINSSDNGSLHDDLVETIVGDGARLIRGEEVFRSLAGVNWLILMNLGLKHSFSRAIRFTMYVGADIKQGLAEALQHGKFKSNLFGRGFEHGEKTSIGCSYKGRMWSHKVARDIPEWVAWCHEVGAKLLDERIDPQEILKHVLVPRRIQERPPLVPLSIEWSEDFLGRSEDAVYLAIAEELVPLYEVGLELVDPSRDGPLRFRISGETNSAEYDVVFRENTVEYVPVGDATVDIVTRRRESLTSFLQRESPVLRFENGAFLIYDALFEPDPTQRSPFDREQIEVWNWEGTNIRKESQYDPPDFANPRLDSIQYRTMQELLRPGQDPDFDIVFDDDERGEAADIVALKVANDRLIVHLYHCKYAGGDNAGARLDDLYVVCGQAQRSVYRRGDVAGLFDHLRLREVARVEKCGVSRFARG
ncbi:MAG: DEAD/DEAH box helicase family protein, partial [Chloroflexia bacterium]|nr:DEAD/DEAH box helicase family protein [Chloroflexia bacterium]